jgi:hypothetical protein
MIISEQFIEQNQSFGGSEAITPPISMSELPDPNDLIEDEEEFVFTYNDPLQQKPQNFIEFAEKTVKDVVNVSPVVADELQCVANVSPVVADELQPVVNVSPVVADELQSIVNVIPIVTDELQFVVNVSPVVADEFQTVVNVSSIVADELQTVVNVSSIVADGLVAVTDTMQPESYIQRNVVKKEENAKEVRKIDGEVASAVISCYPSSLQEIKDYYLKTSFTNQRELTAYICKNFKRVFEVDNHIADLNRMTLERNQLKQQLEEGSFENDKEFVALQKEVVAHLSLINELMQERDALKEKVVILSESSYNPQEIITLISERDGYKNSLEKIERQSLDEKIKEATSTETWQIERQRLFAEFTQGLKDTQTLAFEHSAELFNYAIDNALHLIYQDTERLHKGKGWLSVSELRPQSEFYTLFRKHFQEYFEYAEKIKETEELNENNNHA